MSRFGETWERSRWLTVAGGRSGMESSDLTGASGETEVIADSVPDYPFVVGSQATVGDGLGPQALPPKQPTLRGIRLLVASVRVFGGRRLGVSRPAASPMVILPKWVENLMPLGSGLQRETGVPSVVAPFILVAWRADLAALWHSLPDAVLAGIVTLVRSSGG